MHAQSMEGLSARSVIINAFCQLVILLYLFDNETSFVVLLSAVLVRLAGCCLRSSQRKKHMPTVLVLCKQSWI